MNNFEISFVTNLFKKKGTIAFTNGCFDIFHRGHLNTLIQASLSADFLIVGVNSDSSVKQLKGESRPINKCKDRVRILQELNCVSAVFVFEEPTPVELIKFISPDVLVKGGDYTPDQVIGAEYAKEVRIIPFLQGYSTTKIIEKIKNI